MAQLPFIDGILAIFLKCDHTTTQKMYGNSNMKKFHTKKLQHQYTNKLVPKSQTYQTKQRTNQYNILKLKNKKLKNGF